MKIKTQDLTGTALDWAVAIINYKLVYGVGYITCIFSSKGWVARDEHRYSTDWSQGGPIIEREDIAMWPDQEGGWFASTDQGKGMDYHGGTALIAAMRCFVASKLGDTIDIPEELL